MDCSLGPVGRAGGAGFGEDAQSCGSHCAGQRPPGHGRRRDHCKANLIRRW